MDFGSLNLDNLGDIVSSLSDDDIAKLSSLADELFSSTEKKNGNTSQSSPKSTDFFSGINPDMMAKMVEIIGRLNSAPNDPRCDFIASLKPLLSKDKQQKADDVIKMIQLMSLIPILGDSF